MDEYRRTCEARGAADIIEMLGLSSGEISARKARDTYKKWFLDSVKRRRITPSRVTNKTSYYRVSDILALKEKDMEKAIAII